MTPRSAAPPPRNAGVERAGLRVRGSTRVVGIIGDPVAHSLSPAMHNAAFSALAMDWVYVPFPVAPTSLGQAIRGLRALGIAGVNVTVPHKEAVLRYLDGSSELARRVGAVNTIVHRSGQLWGENTDVYGVRQALRAVRLRGASAMVVGAGGAARAVLVALEQAGVRRVILANRTVARARRVARQLGTPTFFIDVHDLGALEDPRLLAHVRLVVNTTSVGLHGEGFFPLNVDATPAECVFFDLVYGRRTEFLGRAQAAGRLTIDGTEMLLYQGAAAFRLWTGRRPPVEVMRDALTMALKGQRAKS